MTPQFKTERRNRRSDLQSKASDDPIESMIVIQKAPEIQIEYLSGSNNESKVDINQLMCFKS